MCPSIPTGGGPVGGSARARIEPKSLDDYKAVLYKNQPEGWVAEVR